MSSAYFFVIRTSSCNTECIYLQLSDSWTYMCVCISLFSFKVCNFLKFSVRKKHLMLFCKINIFEWTSIHHLPTEYRNQKNYSLSNQLRKSITIMILQFKMNLKWAIPTNFNQLDGVDVSVYMCQLLCILYTIWLTEML